jgi:hypothetical protein
MVCISVIPPLRKLRDEKNNEFKASMGCIA